RGPVAAWVPAAHARRDAGGAHQASAVQLEMDDRARRGLDHRSCLCRPAPSRQSIGPMSSQPAASPISCKLMNASAVTTPHADPAARRRDADAFARLIGPSRAELQAHCYRMVGSAGDGEEALQETLLRAWRGLPRFQRRSSLRSWLYRIATNACLTMIERRPPRVLPLDFGGASDPHDPPGRPLVEPVWLEPYPDEALEVEDAAVSPDTRYERRESIEPAFIAAPHH